MLRSNSIFWGALFDGVGEILARERWIRCIELV